MIVWMTMGSLLMLKSEGQQCVTKQKSVICVCVYVYIYGCVRVCLCVCVFGDNEVYDDGMNDHECSANIEEQTSVMCACM